MPLLGELLVRISADATAYAAQMASAATKTEEFGAEAAAAHDTQSGLMGGMMGMAKFTLVSQAVSYAFVGIQNAIKDTIDVTKQHELVQQQTADVIKSTGGAAGQTATSIDDLAEKYSRLTMFSDDTIASTENMLLTFTNIKGNVFPQATTAVLNVAQAMGEDTKSAAIQLGKALNDPQKGMSALQRIGVTFDATQKKQIANFEKSGNMAGAQAIILKELNKEFGNSAQGAGKTMAGALAILHNNLSIVEEKIGNAVIPVFTQLVTAAMPLVGIIGTGLADAFDVVGGWLKQIGPLFSQVSLTVGPFAGILSNLEAHADGIGSTFMNQVVPALEAFIPSGNQISGIVTDLQNDFNQLAPIVANIAAAIMDGLNQALGTLAPLISTLGGLFTGTIIPAFIALLPHIINLYDGVAQILPPVLSLANAILSVAVGIATGLAPVLQVLIPILTQLYGWIADQVGAALKAMAPVVQQASDGVNKFSGQLSEKLEPAMKRVGAAIQTMVAFIQPLWNAVWPGMEEVFAGVWSIIQGIIQIAWSILSNTFLFWLDIISGNWSGAWQDMQNMFSGIWQGIEKILGGVLQIIWGSVQEWFGTMFNGFKGAGSNIMNALTSAVTEGASKFLSSLKSMASNALSAVKGVFGIHSPSTEFAAIGTNISLGLIQGVQGVDVASQVSDHMAGAITAMGSPTITGAVPSGDALSGSGSGGGRPLTIIFQMPDGQQMVQYLGQPLADELRVRLGLKF